MHPRLSNTLKTILINYGANCNDIMIAKVSTHQLVVVSHEALEVDKAADGGRQVGQLVPAEIRDHIL